MDPQALTTKDVMKFLNVGDPDTIYAMVRAGKLRAVRLGRRYRFDPRQVRAFLRGEPDARPATERPRPRPEASGGTVPVFPKRIFLRKANAPRNQQAR